MSQQKEHFEQKMYVTGDAAGTCTSGRTTPTTTPGI
jgi:hypothetical protein